MRSAARPVPRCSHGMRTRCPPSPALTWPEAEQRQEQRGQPRFAPGQFPLHSSSSSLAPGAAPSAEAEAKMGRSKAATTQRKPKRIAGHSRLINN